MHSSNTCRCTQAHTLDWCRIMHVKHERATMDGICVNEKQFSSYAAHDSEWLWSKYAEMQTFKTCSFFVNRCIWQALHKAQAHTSSHKKWLVLKPWNHTRTCRAFTNHETTAQSTRRDVTNKHLAQCSRTLGPHIWAWNLGAYRFSHRKGVKQIGSYSVTAKKSMLGSDSEIMSPLPSLPKPNASNMHITSVGTKTEDPKPQQPR
jgi:hypothetical protein